METINFPVQNLTIPRLSLGTWVFSGSRVWGEADTNESVATIHAALDQGVNLLDTAEGYGNGKAEEVVGLAVQDRRSRVLLASKVLAANMAADNVISSCEQSLQRLGTDYLDIYQLHWPSRTIPMEETVGALNRLVEQGKVRHVSVCNFNEHFLNRYAEVARQKPLMNQLPYSAVWRMAERFMPEDAALAAASDTVLRPAWAYSPLAQGLLTGKFRTLEDVPLHRRDNRMYSSAYQLGRHKGNGYEQQIFAFLEELFGIQAQTGISVAALSLNFLKTRKSVASILVGCRSRQQLADNIRAFSIVVPQEVMDTVDALSLRLKSQMGPNPDLWEGTDDAGGRFD